MKRQIEYATMDAWVAVVIHDRIRKEGGGGGALLRW